MSVKLVKEVEATGESYAIYQIEVPFYGDWWSVLEIEATFVDNRIDLTKPIRISLR